MKRTFLTMFATLCAALAFTGCVKDEQYVGPPSVSDFAFSPLGVTPADEVIVSATISDLNGIKTVDLYYTINGAGEQKVAMTVGEASKYVAKIAAQELDTKVELWIVAVNSKDLKTTTEKKSYTVSNEAVGKQSDIRINQVGTAGGAKYIGIYNTSSSPVILTNMYFVKNNEGQWGDKFGDVTIPGNGFAVYRAKGTEVFEGVLDVGQNLDGGISGSKSLLFELKNSEGVTVDAFCNVKQASPKVSDKIWDGELEWPFDIAGRVPDGTGDWFVLTDAVPGTSNAAATKGNQFVNQVDITVAVDPTAPTIASVTAAPVAVQPTDDVTVTAEITNDAQSTLSAPVLKYKVGDAASFTDVVMTAVEGKENTYSGIIPAQADKSVVTYKVYVANSANLNTESAEASYTVSAETPEADYTKLVLNEVNGNIKAVEIYNSGDVEIDIAGCTLQKDGATVWTAPAYTLDAAGYVVVYSSKATLPEGYDASLVFSGGLSAGKAVKVELFDPATVALDVFERTGEGDCFADVVNSFSRVPDATGDWYYAASTLGSVNGVACGVIGVTAPVVAFNELFGNEKKIEIINLSAEEVDIAGYKMYKDDGETEIWIAPADTKIAAGGFLTLTGDKNATAADYATKFASGLSAGKSIKMALKDASGNLVDVFIRGNDAAGWGEQKLAEKTDMSFSRIATEGSWGAWTYALPTIGAANGETTGEIEVK